MDLDGSGGESEIVDIEIPVHQIVREFPYVSTVTDQNGILDRLEDHLLIEEAYFRSDILSNKDPEVRIYIRGFFDWTFPSSLPPVVSHQYGMSDEEIGHANAKFFNEHCTLYPVTTKDGIFLSKEKLEELGEIYTVDHGYHHPCDPRFEDDCDYAITATGVILLDKITDLDIAIDLLNKECDRNCIDFDHSENFSLSDIGVMMDSGWNQSNSHGFRYQIDLNFLTQLTKTTDWENWRPIPDNSKLEILRNHIRERDNRIDTRFQHPSMNLVELDFYSVIATPSKTTIGLPLILSRAAPGFPFPHLASPDYVEWHRFVELEKGKIPDVYHGGQYTELGHKTNPIWNIRHQMLLEAMENSIHPLFDTMKKNKEKRNPGGSD